MDKFMKRYGKPVAYRVQWLAPASMAWRVATFQTMRAACLFRSDCEAGGVLAVLMPQQ